MKPFDPDRSYAWLAGIGQRPEDAPAMAISADDAEHLQLALTNYCKMQQEKIACFTREHANAAALLDGLNTLIATTRQQPADLVVIYFSGHGFVLKGKYYIACHDSLNTDLENTAISGTDFLAKLNSIVAEKVLVLLDCCHAGGVTRLNSANVVVADLPFDEQSFLMASANRVVLTACHRSQVSYLSKPVSLFTYALIEGLGGHYFQQGDQDVTLFDLAMYVRERVAVLSRQVLEPHEEEQKPELNVIENSATENFRLARYPNGKPKKLFFKEDFASLRSPDGAKVIKLDVPVEQDNNYRTQFKWIKNRDIIIKGNKNLTVLGDSGPITINESSSTDDVIAILELMERKDMRNHQLISFFMQYHDERIKQYTLRMMSDEKDAENKKKQEPVEKEFFSKEERERLRKIEPSSVLMLIRNNRYVYLRLSPNRELVYEIRPEPFSQKVIKILQRLLMEDSMREDEYATLGISLFNRLFSDDNTRNQFYFFIKEFRIEPLKIILLFDASSVEFACLPWEYMFCELADEKGFFIASNKLLILTRRLVGNHLEYEQQPFNAIKLLFAVSHHAKQENPGQPNKVFDEKGLRKEFEALSHIFNKKLVFNIEYFESMAEMGQYLQLQDRFHVIHLIGFTRLNNKYQEGNQYEFAFSPAFDAAIDKLEWVNHIGLSDKFGLKKPLLCFLHACRAEGAMGNAANPEEAFIAVSGLAFYLANKVAGVLAFQAAVDTVNSNTFLRYIYNDLMKGTDLDAAVNRSLRKMASGDGNTQQSRNRTFGISAVYSNFPISLKLTDDDSKRFSEIRVSRCPKEYRRGSTVEICNNEIALNADGTATKKRCPKCDNLVELCPHCHQLISEKMKTRNICYSCDKPLKKVESNSAYVSELSKDAITKDAPAVQGISNESSAGLRFPFLRKPNNQNNSIEK